MCCRVDHATGYSTSHHTTDHATRPQGSPLCFPSPCCPPHLQPHIHNEGGVWVGCARDGGLAQLLLAAVARVAGEEAARRGHAAVGEGDAQLRADACAQHSTPTVRHTHTHTHGQPTAPPLLLRTVIVRGRCEHGLVVGGVLLSWCGATTQPQTLPGPRPTLEAFRTPQRRPAPDPSASTQAPPAAPPTPHDMMRALL